MRHYSLHPETGIRFVELHGIEPAIDRTFDFDDAVAAYRHLETGRVFGKVVVAVL